MKIVASLACLAFLTACGGPAVQKVTLKAMDTMKYDKDMFTMRLGETLEVTLKNVGKMAKEVMGHNMVVLKPGTDTNAFGGASVTAKENDYIPESKKDEIIVHTKLLGPGESDVLKFKPTAAGDYPFICSFPGHYGTMKGIIRVKG